MKRVSLVFVGLLTYSMSVTATVTSQLSLLEETNFLVSNPDYDPVASFFDPDSEPENISLSYIDSISTSWASFSVTNVGEVNKQGSLSTVDVHISGSSLDMEIDATWGWTDTQAGFRYNSCIGDYCDPWGALGLYDVTRYIDNEDTLYLVADVRMPGEMDLMVGIQVDRLDFWNEQKGYITPEQYAVSQVPVPAAMWLFGSALIGLFRIKGMKG